MQPKTNARLIGAFVAGGIALLLAGIIAFSATEWFSRRMEFVMYFDSSLNGLEIGSPVSFRGVDIGSVTNIVMEIDQEQRRVLTPVYVAIEPERFKSSSFNIPLLTETPLKRMIENGLRAQLQTRSWITGQMYIELEFHPSFPAHLKGDKDNGIDEIPTIPSQLDQVQATLHNVLESLRRLELQKLVDTSVATLQTAHAAIYEIYDASHRVNQKLDGILENIDTTSAKGRETLEQLQKTLIRLNKAVEDASILFASAGEEIHTVAPNVNKSATAAGVAFNELATAMRALGELADYLERNPDALLTGKQDRR